MTVASWDGSVFSARSSPLLEEGRCAVLALPDIAFRTAIMLVEIDRVASGLAAYPSIGFNHTCLVHGEGKFANEDNC